MCRMTCFARHSAFCAALMAAQPSNMIGLQAVFSDTAVSVHHILHSLLYCANGAGGNTMNSTQPKRPKAGHSANPPPRRDIIAYANAVYGYQ